ncbi:hypothetical protein BC938DRAFT_473302 [Jimgerdemannia flammicorona]|uniref:Uncharacterized protein n=1 Tax=Jimgerdemannia flammicorona TaxID=994334 RepID=A0A433QTE0_9FUNG|nr:hypothetical protein BC938DRAFT_473302 [Jimgerdemannia flammicorona]
MTKTSRSTACISTKWRRPSDPTGSDRRYPVASLDPAGQPLASRRNDVDHPTRPDPIERYHVASLDPADQPLASRRNDVDHPTRPDPIERYSAASLDPAGQPLASRRNGVDHPTRLDPMERYPANPARQPLVSRRIDVDHRPSAVAPKPSRDVRFHHAHVTASTAHPVIIYFGTAVSFTTCPPSRPVFLLYIVQGAEDLASASGPSQAATHPEILPRRKRLLAQLVGRMWAWERCGVDEQGKDHAKKEQASDVAALLLRRFLVNYESNNSNNNNNCNVQFSRYGGPPKQLEIPNVV